MLICRMKNCTGNAEGRLLDGRGESMFICRMKNCTGNAEGRLLLCSYNVKLRWA